MRWLSLILAIAVSVAFSAPNSPRAAIAPEYAIKAVFLFHLVKYADWPAAPALADASKPIVIAVIGEDPFGDTLDEAVRDRNVRGRSIQIIRANSVKGLPPVHLAFLSASDPARAAEWIHALAGGPTLTVGDTESAARAGAVVTFVMAQEKVRFDVNMSAARRAHIELSSQLLKLARQIREP